MKANSRRQMLGLNDQQHKRALWQTHPGWTGVGQHAVGGLDVWRWTSPRQEAAVDAQILEPWPRLVKNVICKRGVGNLPGFGQKQNPQGAHGANSNIQNHKSVAPATKGFGRPQINCHVSGHDDPETGPNSLEWNGEPERLLLLTDPNKNEPNPAIKPSRDDLEAGQPSTSEKKPLSKYEQKMAEIRKLLKEIKLQQQTEAQLEQIVPKAQDGQRGLSDSVQGCCFPYGQRRSGLGAPARQHCAIDPSRGSDQGSIGWYGTSDQSMENPNTDDSKPKGGETGRIFMMSHTKPISSQENHTKVEKPNVDISFPHSVVEGMMLKQLGLSHGAQTISMPLSSHSSCLGDGAKTHIFTK
jgi:hypothetical protein